MKHFNFIIILTLLICGCSEPNETGSWEMVRSQNDDLTYREISFTNYDVGWIVGDNGSILKTTDGGYTWQTQGSGVTAKLWGVSSVSQNIVWVCGSNGTLIKTTNGGSNWQVLMQGDTLDGILIDVFFVNENVGWLSNNNGSIQKTVDGGNTWALSKKHSSAGSWIFAFDELTQYHVHGNLFRTFDGGATWDSLDILRPTNYMSSGVSFPDKDHGFVSMINGTGGMIIEEYPVVSTFNGGQSWKESKYLETGNGGFTCVSFVDGQTGWVGGPHNVFRTNDGGQSFTSEKAPDNFYPADMMFININHGWALSYSGEVYKYLGD